MSSLGFPKTRKPSRLIPLISKPFLISNLGIIRINLLLNDYFHLLLILKFNDIYNFFIIKLQYKI